jgi:hypothetical protein
LDGRPAWFPAALAPALGRSKIPVAASNGEKSPRWPAGSRRAPSPGTRLGRASRSRSVAAYVFVVLLGMFFLSGTMGWAQWRRNRDARTARDIEGDAEPPAAWKNPPAFTKDVFTFARIRYSGNRWSRYGRGAGVWDIDAPDSDLNFSFRLQQLTSIKTDPDGKIVEITDPELFTYPWVYMVEPGGLQFLDEEVEILRRYLLNGGFLMVDDFWGERQWLNFYNEIKRVFPHREPVELEMSHPIFRSVFPLEHFEKNKLQVPNFDTGERSQYNGVTWEYHDGEECREVHFKAIFDDKGRIMVMICHNTDLGDGWEREGVYQYYFREFSEKIAYPLGINIVFYSMTH